jgi:hypothetical protein
VCGRLMSPAHETQSMREIRLLRGRLPRKGGGSTSGAVTAYLSGAPEFYPVFTCISGARFVHVVKFNVSRFK